MPSGRRRGYFRAGPIQTSAPRIVRISPKMSSHISGDPGPVAASVL